MSKKLNVKLTVLFVLSASLITSAVTAGLLTVYYRNVCYHILGGFCESMLEKNPDFRQAVLEVLKTQDFYSAGKNMAPDRFDGFVISDFGYQPSNLGISDTAVLWTGLLAFLAGGILFLFAFWYLHKRSSARIQTLTEHLGRINAGGQGLLFESSEDEFSKLQDEIYKTVTALYQTREEALAARNHFAENLSNIAHQLKTPITAISLTLQTAEKYMEDAHALDIRREDGCAAEVQRENTARACKVHDVIKGIERQISRLMHLEESLLLLSRIDAGTLVLDRKPADVFTILSLASDNLYELSMQKGVLIDVPEMGEIEIPADLNWTMEAVMNLMKNCIEAAEAGAVVHCSYEKNPLYVQVRIWDEGEGFVKKDIPHLFERFYRGENAKDTGIGIGLSLSKEIIEMQNGIIRAFNLPDGGACFEIRFYTL